MSCGAEKRESSSKNIETLLIDREIKLESSSCKLESLEENNTNNERDAPLLSSDSKANIVDDKEDLHEQLNNGQVHFNTLGLESLPKEYQDSYTRYINEVEAIASVPIIKSVSEGHIQDFQHFNIRYYEDKYCTEFGTNKDSGNCDTNVRIHTNKLMLVALASGNDIIQNAKPIVHISFVINDNDRAKVCLKGKKKKGSKAVERGTILCQVKCQDDDKLYNIRSGVSGRIIEINEHIKSRPDLLRTEPKGLGFVAVLAPKDKEGENLKHLLTEDEYHHYIVQRH